MPDVTMGNTAKLHHSVPQGYPRRFEVLSGVEGEAISILGKLEGSEFPLSESDRRTFSYYMALRCEVGRQLFVRVYHVLNVCNV